MESRSRSVLKALTWRLAALGITVATAWAITGKAEVAASIGLADSTVKLLAYYLHERAWIKVEYGRMKPPEYQI